MYEYIHTNLCRMINDEGHLLHNQLPQIVHSFHRFGNEFSDFVEKSLLNELNNFVKIINMLDPPDCSIVSILYTLNISRKYSYLRIDKTKFYVTNMIILDSQDLAFMRFKNQPSGNRFLLLINIIFIIL